MWSAGFQCENVLMPLLILPVSIFLLLLKISEPYLYHYIFFILIGSNNTGQSHNVVLSGVGIFLNSFQWSMVCLLCISLHPPFMSGDPRAGLTGFSQRYDTSGSLFSPSRSLFFFIAVADKPRLPLAVERGALPVVLLKHFFTNRKCFESAVGFLTAQRINSEEPARLSHMIQHPLINATQCCVTKSQLHHALSD